MDRVKRATSETLSKTWTDRNTGAIVDPGTVTVGITRADGTVVVAPGTATSGGGAAARTFVLTTAHTALLDDLTVTWTTTNQGTDPDLVQIVGDVLFTVADARRIKPLDNTTTYTTADIVAMRTMVEQALEEACGVAFVPRYTREKHVGNSGLTVHLRWPYVQAIRSVESDGTAWSPGELSAAHVSTYGTLWSATRLTADSLVVGYEHGHGYPPPEVSRAGLILLKAWLVGRDRPIDERAITFNAAEGGTYSLAVPGRNGSQFGHPDVDVVVQRYSMSVGVD